jgi:integrating conjugative element protein (TIGR03759 family)
MGGTGVYGAVVGLLLLSSATALADVADSTPLETPLTDTALSVAERRQAQRWQLTEAEWRHYQSLMEGIRGSLSVATISPVEVLGIHARDEAERRRYAERWAQLMHEDAERVLAFQRAYSEAFQRLYPDEPLIDLGQLPGAAPAISFQPGDRLLFFARTDCGPCSTLVPSLLRILQKHPGVGLDIYLTDSVAGEDDKVRTWARTQGIPPELVKARTVTLNHDNGLLKQLADNALVPYLVHRRADRFTALTPASLGRSP